jgi:hypothetical protein
MRQRRRRLQRRAHRQLVDRRGKDLFHVVLKQGLLGGHAGLMIVSWHCQGPETEKQNPPLGRVGCCSRELARQMRNGGNNAGWVGKV